MKKVPFFKHRILSEATSSKFSDDYYLEHTKKLQKLRKFRHISYNPCTGEYLNGNTHQRYENPKMYGNEILN